jgi:Cu2+-exporting ATPase
LGVEALDGDVAVWGGKQEMAESRLTSPIPTSLLTAAEALSEQGKTPLYFAREGKLLGMIVVADVIRADSPAAIRALRDLGLRVILLSGDNERTARAIGAQVGVDEVIAGAGLPVAQAKAALTMLEIKGVIASLPGGRLTLR